MHEVHSVRVHDVNTKGESMKPGRFSQGRKNLLFGNRDCLGWEPRVPLSSPSNKPRCRLALDEIKLQRPPPRLMDGVDSN